MRELQVNQEGKATDTRRASAFPHECPLCHFKVEPLFLYSWQRDGELQACFRCPHKKCQSLFIAYYREGSDRSGDRIYDIRSTAPWRVLPNERWAPMADVSPDFVSIANQANAAEHFGLVEIAGVGYRKALEFLIKDYLIKTGVDPATVRSKLLGNCINDHVQEPRLKECAKRAAWLGNDETHYVRKWADLGLDDLKHVIALTVAWIELETHTEALLQKMPSGRP